jgi:hypothetical protein
VNYAFEGRTNGTTHAERDVLGIKSVARASGTASGSEDGNSGTYRSPSPRSDLTCLKTFTFDAHQDPLYVSGYESAYEAKCSELFASAFNQTYASAYDSAEILREQSEAKKQADQNAIWWWIIGGGVVIWIIWAIVSSYKND